MYNIRKITEEIIWVGTNDKRLELFENLFPIPNGVSYNSYIINDEKTALIDTVDSSTVDLYLANVKAALKGRTLDYLIVNHMEPDHCGVIPHILMEYPNVKVVGNTKTFEYLEAFYRGSKKPQYHTIQEGDILHLGKHHLTFYSMPMVHWPEVMVAYESTNKLLFSADAFGTFNSLDGNLYNDEANEFLDEARRYFSNIVGKYGAQAHAALKKLGGLDISIIAPLHGPIWRNNLGFIIDKYVHWSTYVPERPGVVILYGSMYGNTELAAQTLANKLGEIGVEQIRIFDISKTDSSYIVAAIWEYSNVVFAAPTYNLGLFPMMKALLSKLEAVNFQNRKVSLIGNYTWVDASISIMQKILSEFINLSYVGDPLLIKSSLSEDGILEIEKLAEEIKKSLK